MKYILILGAKSDMAMSLAREYAYHGYHLILAGRQIEQLSDFANSIEEAFEVSTQLVEFDILKYETHQPFFDDLKTKPTGVICAVGYLGDQHVAQYSFTEAQRIIKTNYMGCVSILDICAAYLEHLKEGFIIGISSVAGERGRKSNYIYGSAKAGFTQYLSGLRARLANNPIHVMTVKPGFVYTKMTAHLQLPTLLSMTPDRVAKVIFKAQRRKKNVVYVKWVWRYIMLVIRLIPEVFFKKMKF